MVLNFSLFIARRYLQANRENRFVSWISTLSIIGIAIGGCAMIVVLSVINGFENELRNRFLAANAHILAYRFPAGLKNYELWQDHVLQDFGQHLTGVSPFVHFETMGRKDYIIHAMLIKGIAPDQREKVQPLSSIIKPDNALKILQQEFDQVLNGQPLPEIPAIIIGIRLKENMQVEIGDNIELIAPSADEDGPFKEMQTYRVVGFYDSGLQHYDKQIGIMSVPAAQKLFNLGNIVTGLEIGLKNPNESKEIASLMSEKYRISIKEWQSYNSNIFEAMHNERNVIGLIVALVAFVASFNILTTLFISVTQKRRDIAILKSLGASNHQVLQIFLKQSLLIGLIGSTIGIVLAFILAKIIENVNFIDLPDIYLLANLPVSYDPSVYLLVATASVLIASVAGLYPAWSATRVNPTQGLKESDQE